LPKTETKQDPARVLKDDWASTPVTSLIPHAAAVDLALAMAALIRYFDILQGLTLEAPPLAVFMDYCL